MELMAWINNEYNEYNNITYSVKTSIEFVTFAMARSFHRLLSSYMENIYVDHTKVMQCFLWNDIAVRSGKRYANGFAVSVLPRFLKQHIVS